MVDRKPYSSDDDLDRAKDGLKKFMIDVSRALKFLVKNNPIPVDNIFQENEDELNRLLENALNDLEIDYNGETVESKIRIAAIIFEIDRLDKKSLESVGLIGRNFELKRYVYEKVAKDFDESLRTNESSNENRSWGARIKSFFRWKDTADSIMASLAKLVPLIEPIIEFKDIYSNTRKSLDNEDTAVR